MIRLILLICLLMQTRVFATPKVAVTLKPIHSLVASVMAGVGTPELLLPDGASPHTYQLKPSTVQAIHQADLIIWVGPELETFMEKAVARKQSNAFALLSIPKLLRLTQRNSRHWHDDNHQHDHAHDSNIDPHIWLSVHNAKIMVDAIAQKLIAIDPVNAKVYAANRLKMAKELNTLFKTMDNDFKTVRQNPFLIYHDGYQYLEKEFGLNGKGSIILNPNVPLSGKVLQNLKQQVAKDKISCVFTEAEFNQQQLEKNLRILNVRFAELDPLGFKQTAGPACYTRMMAQIAKTMQGCLE